MVSRKNSTLLIVTVLAALAIGSMNQRAEAQVYYYAPTPVYVAPAPVVYSAPVYVAPAPVVYAAPAYYYPAYAYRPYGFGFSVGYYGGHHGYHGGYRHYGHGGRGFGFSFGYRGHH